MADPKFVPVQYQDKNGDWRVKLAISREGIHSPRRQEVFLEELAKHGRAGDAARAAGVATRSVRQLRDRDAEFDEACIAASQAYTDRLVAHHQELVFEGQNKVTYDRQGNVVSEEKVYPIRLIELELKKHDEGYRDKREVDMKVSGGVLVAPPEVSTIDDWEEKFSADKTIDGEAQEVETEEK